MRNFISFFLSLCLGVLCFFGDCTANATSEGLDVDRIHSESIKNFTSQYTYEKIAKRIHRYENLLPHTNGNMTEGAFSIPAISHHIWLTPEKAPKEMKPYDADNLRRTIAVIEGDTHRSWKHILWTNAPSLIPETLGRLSSTPIEVRNLHDYTDILKTLDVVFSFIGNPRVKGAMGVAADLLRYDLLDVFGGYYGDINFQLVSSPEPLMQAFDFFVGGVDELLSLVLENSMIGSIPNHPILEKTLMTLMPILRSPTLIPPSKDPTTTIADKITFSLFMWLCLENMNQQGTRDVILYPQWHQRPNDLDEDVEIDEDDGLPEFLNQGDEYELRHGLSYPGAFGYDGKGRSWQERVNEWGSH